MKRENILKVVLTILTYTVLNFTYIFIIHRYTAYYFLILAFEEYHKSSTYKVLCNLKLK